MPDDFFGITDKKQLNKIGLVLNVFNENDKKEKERMLKIIGELTK